MMTPDQAEVRAERVAIMIYDGGITRQEAEAYCDTQPELYGKYDLTEEDL